MVGDPEDPVSPFRAWIQPIPSHALRVRRSHPPRGPSFWYKSNRGFENSSIVQKVRGPGRPWVVVLGYHTSLERLPGKQCPETEKSTLEDRFLKVPFRTDRC